MTNFFEQLSGVFGLPEVATLVAALCVIFAGWKLTHCAEKLATLLNLGHGFVGLVLLGWTTSLPELVMSVGASVQGAPAMGSGNIVGSISFNLLIIAAMDVLFFRQKPLLMRTNRDLALSGIYSCILIVLCAVALFMGFLEMSGGYSLTLWGRLGFFTLIIGMVYVVATFNLYHFERQQNEDDGADQDKGRGGLPGVIMMTLSLAGLIVFAGLWLANLGDTLQVKYNLSQSIVGAVLLGIISSLPELVTAIAAMRIGQVDMMVGSIFGSNIFNVTILGVADLFYLRGSLWKDVVAQKINFYQQSIGLFMGVAMTLVIILELNYKSRRSFLNAGMTSCINVLIFVFGYVAIWKCLGIS